MGMIVEGELSDRWWSFLQAGAEMGIAWHLLAPDERQYADLLQYESGNGWLKIYENTPENVQRLWKNVGGIFSGKSLEYDRARLCVKHGVVPICPAGIFVENFQPVQEFGTGFTFREGSEWGAVQGVLRAGETSKFPYDWSLIKRQMKKQSAKW